MKLLYLLRLSIVALPLATAGCGGWVGQPPGSVTVQQNNGYGGDWQSTWTTVYVPPQTYYGPTTYIPKQRFRRNCWEAIDQFGRKYVTTNCWDEPI